MMIVVQYHISTRKANVITTYEMTPAEDIQPGAIVKFRPDDEPVKITIVRHHFADNGAHSVSLYREPTDEEYEAFLGKQGEDLKATWVSTAVASMHYLCLVPHHGLHLNLAY